jgi:CheY-like chemotaxis protein
VKFTERGLVKIEVSRAPGGALELRVRDTGPGIPAEHLTSIFSEFFQVRNDERDRSKGSGLGLAISRRIMQAFGGSLQVESRIGAGSVFTATLPAERVLGEPPASSGLSEAPLTGRDLPDHASILVIDDDAISREALIVLLEEEGYEVLTASGGEEGLKAVEEHRPNVLLLDMMMPGMDGVEVIRRIRQEPELGRVRIIALTGDVTRERRQKVFESGADQFVAKPFRIPELLDTVREILRQASFPGSGK